MPNPPDLSQTHGSPDPASFAPDAAPALPRPIELPSPEDDPLIVLARLSDGILVFDRDWRITFANDEARRVGHLTPADFNSRTHWEIYPMTIGTPLETQFRACMETGVASRFEFFFPPTNVWVDAHLLPLPNGMAVQYRDVTAQHEAEALRDAAAHQLRQVLEATTDSIVSIDRNWKCTFANRAAHTILKTENLVGMDLWTDFPGNQAEPFASNYRRTMDERVPTQFEAYYPAPLDIWFSVQAQPSNDDGIIIFSREITSRKRAETLRDAYARRLDQVLEVTTDAIGSFDRNWTITFANDRARALLHRPDLIGKNLWEEFPAAVDSVFSINYRLTMEQRIPTEFEAFYPEPLNRWYSQQCRPSEDGIVVFFRDITAIRNDELTVRRQRNLIAFVQQFAHIAFFTLNLETTAIHFDEGSYLVYGHPFSFINNIDNLRSILHPEDLPRIRTEFEHAARTGEPLVTEYRVFDQIGRILWLETRAQIDTADGHATQLGGMTIDITARKHNEEALAASEQRYRVLTELNPNFLWTGAPDGRITYANQGFLDFLGIGLTDLDGERWIKSFDPRDRAAVLEAWMRSVLTDVDYQVEARMLTHENESRWCWLRALPLRDEATGLIASWLGVCLDIHDRKTATDALQQKHLETERQRAEIETLYRTAPIGLALFDPVEFRYLRLNDRQAEIVGLPPDQILGRTVTEIAPGIPELHAMFQQVAGGTPIRGALIHGELPMRPGEQRFWTVNYFPVYNPDGSVQAVSAASLEVTHQKKAENALIQSEKLAAVGRLASSISHEINNPLEAVTNLLYLIQQEENISDDLRLYVNTAQSELQRVCQIATQTLRFHRQAVRATLVDPSDLIEPVVDLYQGRLTNSNIAVRPLYRNTRRILCFENDIRQVLNNLIANAIDAMRHGGSLLVRAHDATDYTTPSDQSASLANDQPPATDPPTTSEAPTPRRGIRITIADTGHGISPTTRARLFEPFYTTKDLNGTGLGLWISSGIVARHHGRITLRSSEDPRHRGTIFSIFLPHIAESEIEDSNPHTL